MLFYLRMTLLPAVMEEMVFRGVIFQSLRKFSDPYGPVHLRRTLQPGPYERGQKSLHLPHGPVYRLFCDETNSSLTGMAIHFVNNAYVLTKQLIGSNIPAELLPIFQDISSIALIILGFVALLLLVNRYSGMFTPAAQQRLSPGL